MNFKDLYNNKTSVDFNLINKSMFEELRQKECDKENNLIEWFFSNAKKLNFGLEECVNPFEYFRLAAEKLNEDQIRKLDKVYSRYLSRFLAEINIDLVKDNEELLGEGFFDKYEHLI